MKDPPALLEVALRWSPASVRGEGQMLLMVSSPREDGSGTEYFTKMSSASEQCLRVPAADIEPGLWQVMVHSRGVWRADVHITVTTLGGAAEIPPDVPHSQAEAEDVEARDAEPCAAA